MDILIPEDVARLVEYYPARRPSSAAYRLLSPSGSVVIASTAASVDTLAATVASVVDAETVTVSGVTGSFLAGRYYWLTSADGQVVRVLCGEVDGTTIHLEWGAARALPEVGDTFAGARVTATLSTTATATRGENYALEWTTTNADTSVDVERVTAHVVRAVVRDPVDVGFAKACIAAWWPDIGRTRSYAYFADLAQRASERVFKRVRKGGRYVHLLWSGNDLQAAGRVALQYELAVDKLIPGNVLDLASYKSDLDGELNRELEDVISSRPYDGDDSGAVTETEIAPVTAILLRRW